MPRFFVSALALSLCAAWLAPASVLAGEDAPVIATPEEAEEALETFKREYKAKGLKGDDKLMQRDWAMRELAKLQHPDIVAELAKHSKKKGDLATLAVIYLGEQSAYPGPAGKSIVQAMRKNKKDPVLVMSALQSVAELGYLGARENLVDLMRDRDFAMKKYAIQTSGKLGDVRMMGDLLKLLGVDMKKETAGKDGEEKKTGEKEVTEEGSSWEGVEVNYDTGAEGDSDQKEAERIGKEKLAANKAAAGGGGSGSGSGSGMGGAGGPVNGGGGGRGGSGRSMKELAPVILKALFAMTGEKFAKGSEIKAWLKANTEQLAERCKLLDEMEKAQAKAKAE